MQNELEIVVGRTFNKYLRLLYLLIFASPQYPPTLYPTPLCNCDGKQTLSN